MDNQQESFSLIPIPEYEGYFIDLIGNVYSVRRGNKLKRLKPREHYGKSKNPYMRIHINNQYILVHRLVASVMKGKPLTSEEYVNHKDGITTNNAISNLEIVTHKENIQHALILGLYPKGEEWHKARESSTTIETFKNNRKLKPEQVADIYKRLLLGTETQQAIAKEYEVSNNTVLRIFQKKTYVDITRNLDKVE